ncbi:MAG TPA: sigma-70 family RNA polymerase sigma factor [Thermoanaerobaculia bacterium]|jgi:RNA polymerase sigma factor for flagellar operon FliA|nr:sigma-70 family RNA polymerase sigma factor [Thermoanaerobaculia bacterium]
MDWERFFLDNLPLIDATILRVCRKYGLAGADAEDFTSVIHIKLIEDDYAVLRKFQNKSQLSTYLSVIIQRHYFDQKIHEWGKWRPSILARKAGDAAILLERLVSRDGKSLAEASILVRQNYRELDSRAIEALASSIVRRRAPRASEVEQTDEMPEPASSISADDKLVTSERETTARRTNAIVNRELGRLPSEDRLIMKLHYIDSMKVSTMARLLKADQKRLYRRIKHIGVKLQEALLAAGVAMSDIGDMLINGADSLNFDFGPSDPKPEGSS